MLNFSVRAIGTIGREVTRQGVDANGVVRVCQAIDHTVHISQYLNNLTIEHILQIGALIEPTNKAFRITPVAFNNGGTSAQHSDIPRLMQNWLDAFNAWGGPTIAELIKEFLWIHPFKDGNGRAAFVLLNVFDYSRGIELSGNTVVKLAPLPEFNW